MNKAALYGSVNNFAIINPDNSVPPQMRAGKTVNVQI